MAEIDKPATKSMGVSERVSRPSSADERTRRLGISASRDLDKPIEHAHAPANDSRAGSAEKEAVSYR